MPFYYFQHMKRKLWVRQHTKDSYQLIRSLFYDKCPITPPTKPVIHSYPVVFTSKENFVIKYQERVYQFLIPLLS